MRQQNHVGDQLESDIKSYMKVVNDSILDMTSKYLVLSMIKAVSLYISNLLSLIGKIILLSLTNIAPIVWSTKNKSYDMNTYHFFQSNFSEDIYNF